MTATMDEAMIEAREAAAEPIDKVLERLGERIGAQASVKAVFGDPTERGEVTVVPVARVRWGYGGGSGSGPATAGKSDGQAMTNGTGVGGGVMAAPLGYLEVRPTGATYVPLESPYLNPLVILASGLSITFVIRALARLLRG